MSEPRAPRHGTTDYAIEPGRDMEYRNTKRCAWIDEDGDQCDAQIRTTSTHCTHHAAIAREALRWESDRVSPAGMELVCPPKMAGKWEAGARALFRTQWRAYWRREHYRLIAAWWEL